MKKADRQKVLEKCNGKCAYCGVDLNGKFHVDHLEPVRRISKWENGKFVPTGKMENPERDHIDNMLPSCASCNVVKGMMCLDDFRMTIRQKTEQLLRESNYRVALRYGLIEVKPKKIVFYFETLKEKL